ncbi:MAG: nucleotidyltransferase family protein [Elusimicrobia bacterium]|nr:nucleotidyltransferase family protein [Elusimicrobiota bacterium]
MIPKAMPQEAVLLIGGLGTRLGELTKNTPKPMLPLNGRPFLEYLLLRLNKQGCRRFILAVAYHAEEVRRYFGDGKKWGVDIVYSDPDGRQLGTGGSIKEAEELIKGGHFFVLNGDVYFDAPLRELWAFHAQQAASVTLGLAGVPDGGRYGRVALEPDGHISAFLEKDPGSGGPATINGGLYVFDKKVLGAIPCGADFSLERELFPKLTGRGLYGRCFPKAFFIDIGTPEDYRRAGQLRRFGGAIGE